jgi:hypothetical protein
MIQLKGKDLQTHKRVHDAVWRSVRNDDDAWIVAMVLLKVAISIAVCNEPSVKDARQDIQDSLDEMCRI